MTLYYGASYFSEATTTACWLAGWYALLEWRATRKLHWLLAIAFFTGWDAITRPLTGLAYAIPVGIVVVRDVIVHRRWRDLALSVAMGAAVIAILPVWSMCTTGNWRETPLALYTRMYMPYDVPGFGLVTTQPTHRITPDLFQLNQVYSALHVHHFPSSLLTTIGARARYLSVSVWGVTSGVLGLFALLGLFTLSSATAFAVGSGVLLLVTYLVYATPPQWTLYYYESVPALAYLTAAGLACAASMIGRSRGAANAPTFHWRSPRWTRALAGGALVLALPGTVALAHIHRQHQRDRRDLLKFATLLESMHDQHAVVFVRYAQAHDPHTTYVRNVANPARERIWVVYDRGDAENMRLLTLAPERKGYLFDEASGRTYAYDATTTP